MNNLHYENFLPNFLPFSSIVFVLKIVYHIYLPYFSYFI